MELYVSGEGKRCYYFNMNTTDEWLGYIESQVIMSEYGIKGYSKEKDKENTKDDEDV